MARGIASGKRLSKGSWSRMANRVGMLRFSYQYQKLFRSELLINYFHEKELCSMIANTAKIVTLFCLVLMLLRSSSKVDLPETEGGYFCGWDFLCKENSVC